MLTCVGSEKGPRAASKSLFGRSHQQDHTNGGTPPSGGTVERLAAAKSRKRGVPGGLAPLLELAAKAKAGKKYRMNFSEFLA
jgi:hypothetical protein